jgi:hypothetical protein
MAFGQNEGIGRQIPGAMPSSLYTNLAALGKRGELDMDGDLARHGGGLGKIAVDG